MRTVLTGLALWAATSCWAAELEGVTLEDRIRVDGQDLQLNGIAVRTRALFFKVYVAGLYLPARTVAAQAVLQSHGPKRIILVMLRDATAEQFIESIEGGMRPNNTEAQLAEVQPQIDQLYAMIRAVGQSKKGARIVLDYQPSMGGTTLYVDGAPQGQVMAGKPFYRVLLRIWLGEDPVQMDLKEALLGGVQ